MIQDLIDSALILESLQATDKTGAIDEMLAAAVAHERLARSKLPSIRKKIAEREHLGSTGIGNGVAVPHVKIESFDKTLLILGRSAEGIDFEAIDGRPVQTVFLIVAPGGAAADHLKLLRWVSGLARSADFRRFVGNAAGEAGIRDLLQEMSGP